MNTTDKLTPELRKIETEIDNHYKSNPLVKLPFATAAWHLLATAEDHGFRESINPRTPQELGVIADNLVNDLKYPMSWLYRACTSEGQVPYEFNHDNYQASLDLINLGQEYEHFVRAYTFANRGWLELDLQGSTIQPTEQYFQGAEYYAYDLMIKPHKSQKLLSSMDIDSFPMEALRHSLKIRGDRFKFKLNPSMVSVTISALSSPMLDTVFSLPREWQFSHYTLGDFRKVFEAIHAMTFIHSMAHTIAAAAGCLKMGYVDSIYVVTCNELRHRVVRYSKVSQATVQSILDDLSYGNKDILNLDPALQPLIKLNANTYAIMPHLWFACASERNLTVLLNKLPSERKIYSRLVSQKEELMRKHLINSLSANTFRYRWGSISDLPDINLAIISDSEKACLLLELKWFIGPSEPREIIEKSEEIQKGISQSLKLERAFAENHQALLARLEIDSSYSLMGTVVSENWVGHAKVKTLEIPVIRSDHLIGRLNATERLQSTMEWLIARNYLPRKGKHFETHKHTATIGNWHLKSYAIEPLDSNPFFPL